MFSEENFKKESDSKIKYSYDVKRYNITERYIINNKNNNEINPMNYDEKRNQGKKNNGRKKYE